MVTATFVLLAALTVSTCIDYLAPLFLNFVLLTRSLI